MKDLKYKHQSIFPMWGRVKLILGIGMENQISILRAPATIKYFHQILKNCHFGVKKKSLPTQIHLYSSYMVLYKILWGNYNFPRSTNKIQFFDEISTSGKKLLI